MTQFLRLTLLGDVYLEVGGKPLAGLPSRAAEALLIYLACQKRPISREFLAEMLWAGRHPQQALTNLRTILTALRRQLSDYLIVTRSTLAFNPHADFWLDTDEFEKRMTGLAGLLQSDTPLDESAVNELEAALKLYRGDFLAGFTLRDGPGFEEWAILEQERLRRLAHGGLRRLARHHLETGNYPAGIVSAQKLLALDPYDEEALRLLMWLLARNGQRNAALAQYEAVRRALKRDLNVEPAPESRQIYQRLRELVFPPPNNLPPPIPFIGRERELAEIASWLARPTCRLISILGPGGMGKTWLALETARRMVQARPGQFLDGVFFAPLETLDKAQSLALQLGEILGISFEGTETPQAYLPLALKGKELLLILDNFEHLLNDGEDATSLLTSLLAQAPSVKLLVTSRQRLNLVEEWIFDLGGLDLPQAGQADPLSASAPALFVQVAQRLHRQFSFTDEETSAILHVCQMLEGSPLAIEMAAGWVRRYSCVQIAAQVQSSLDFLRATQRNVPERRRSLRSVFEHSWALLDESEQSSLACLSVLRGNFTAEAASATLGHEAGNSLAVLVDHSLVQRRADERYALHPTLRQYAAEKLAQNPLLETASLERHARFFLRWLGNLGDGEAPANRAAIRAEMANLRQAWEWAVQRRQPDLLERAAPVLHSFFSVESRFLEGIEMFQYALDEFGSLADRHAALVCDLLSRQARMQIHIGQLAAARAGLEQAYTLSAHVGQAEQRATVLGYMAITHYYAGDYVRAAEMAEQALSLSQESGDDAGVATTLNFLGSCHKARGEYALAEQAFERSAQIYHQLTDFLGEAMVLNNLGNLAQARGDYPAASRYYLESSALFKQLDHAHGVSTTLSNAGVLAYHQGEYEQAQALFRESLAMKEKMGDRRGAAIARMRLGDLAIVLGSFESARKQLFQALAAAHQMGDLKLALEILVAVADLFKHRGQASGVARILRFVLQQTAISQEARERAMQLSQTYESDLEITPGEPLTYEEIVSELLEESESSPQNGMEPMK